MLWTLTVLAAIAILLVLAGAIAFTAWGMNWGATAEERFIPMPGDDRLAGGPPLRVVMTRAVSIPAAPEVVWPWIAQLGRGAGWYSIDGLDNGGKPSARHIVSWVPPPRLGDASPIGYLCHLAPGGQMTWWVPGVRFLRAHARLVVDMGLLVEGTGTRLVFRMSADATGVTARPALWVFRFIDTVMARRQLLGIAERVARYGARSQDPDCPETGARDQFQSMEVIYASGKSAGVEGVEQARHWRAAALAAGVLPAEPS